MHLKNWKKNLLDKYTPNAVLPAIFPQTTFAEIILKYQKMTTNNNIQVSTTMCCCMQMRNVRYG